MALSAEGADQERVACAFREVVLLEEFKICLPERVDTYLSEQKVDNVTKATVMVEKFSLTHKILFTSPVVKELSMLHISGVRPSGVRYTCVPKSLPKENRKCFYRHKMGHVIAACAMLKTKQEHCSMQPSSSSVNLLNTIAISPSCSPETDEVEPVF